MAEEDNKRIAHLWYEVMWSKPDPDIADEIVDPNYAPEWIHIDKKALSRSNTRTNISARCSRI